MTKLKDLVGHGNIAHFVRYHSGQLWYKVEYTTTSGGGHLIFPIPIEDTGTGVFEAQVKAITLMRWIRLFLLATNYNIAPGRT